MLKLQSGEQIMMSNVVRTVTRSTMIEQDFKHCSDDDFEPLGRSMLFQILKVRESSQRKSLQGLDNIAARHASQNCGRSGTVWIRTLLVRDNAHKFERWQALSENRISCALQRGKSRTAKATQPQITKAYLRSDGAGCYHNNDLIAAVSEIGKHIGIQIIRYI